MSVDKGKVNSLMVSQREEVMKMSRRLPYNACELTQGTNRELRTASMQKVNYRTAKTAI